MLLVFPVEVPGPSLKPVDKSSNHAAAVCEPAASLPNQGSDTSTASQVLEGVPAENPDQQDLAETGPSQDEVLANTSNATQTTALKESDAVPMSVSGSGETEHAQEKTKEAVATENENDVTEQKGITPASALPIPTGIGESGTQILQTAESPTATSTNPVQPSSADSPVSAGDTNAASTDSSSKSPTHQSPSTSLTSYKALPQVVESSGQITAGDADLLEPSNTKPSQATQEGCERATERLDAKSGLSAVVEGDGNAERKRTDQNSVSGTTASIQGSQIMMSQAATFGASVTTTMVTSTVSMGSVVTTVSCTSSQPRVTSLTSSQPTSEITRAPVEAHTVDPLTAVQRLITQNAEPVLTQGNRTGCDVVGATGGATMGTTVLSAVSSVITPSTQPPTNALLNINNSAILEAYQTVVGFSELQTMLTNILRAGGNAVPPVLPGRQVSPTLNSPIHLGHVLPSVPACPPQAAPALLGKTASVAVENQYNLNNLQLGPLLQKISIAQQPHTTATPRVDLGEGLTVSPITKPAAMCEAKGITTTSPVPGQPAGPVTAHVPLSVGENGISHLMDTQPAPNCDLSVKDLPKPNRAEESIDLLSSCPQLLPLKPQHSLPVSCVQGIAISPLNLGVASSNQQGATQGAFPNRSSPTSSHTTVIPQSSAVCHPLQAVTVSLSSQPSSLTIVTTMSTPSLVVQDSHNVNCTQTSALPVTSCPLSIQIRDVTPPFPVALDTDNKHLQTVAAGAGEDTSKLTANPAVCASSVSGHHVLSTSVPSSLSTIGCVAGRPESSQPQVTAAGIRLDTAQVGRGIAEADKSALKTDSKPVRGGISIMKPLYDRDSEWFDEEPQPPLEPVLTAGPGKPATVAPPAKVSGVPTEDKQLQLQRLPVGYLSKQILSKGVSGDGPSGEVGLKKIHPVKTENAAVSVVPARSRSSLTIAKYFEEGARLQQQQQQQQQELWRAQLAAQTAATSGSAVLTTTGTTTPIPGANTSVSSAAKPVTALTVGNAIPAEKAEVSSVQASVPTTCTTTVSESVTSAAHSKPATVKATTAGKSQGPTCVSVHITSAVEYPRSHLANFVHRSLHTPSLYNSSPHPITSPGFPLDLTESVQKVMKAIPRTDTSPPLSPKQKRTLPSPTHSSPAKSRLRTRTPTPVTEVQGRTTTPTPVVETLGEIKSVVIDKDTSAAGSHRKSPVAFTQQKCSQPAVAGLGKAGSPITVGGGLVYEHSYSAKLPHSQHGSQKAGKESDSADAMDTVLLLPLPDENLDKPVATSKATPCDTNTALEIVQGLSKESTITSSKTLDKKPIVLGNVQPIVNSAVQASGSIVIKIGESESGSVNHIHNSGSASKNTTTTPVSSSASTTKTTTGPSVSSAPLVSQTKVVTSPETVLPSVSSSRPDSIAMDAAVAASSSVDSKSQPQSTDNSSKPVVEEGCVSAAPVSKSSQSKSRTGFSKHTRTGVEGESVDGAAIRPARVTRRSSRESTESQQSTTSSTAKDESPAKIFPAGLVPGLVGRGRKKTASESSETPSEVSVASIDFPQRASTRMATRRSGRVSVSPTVEDLATEPTADDLASTDTNKPARKTRVGSNKRKLQTEDPRTDNNDIKKAKVEADEKPSDEITVSQTVKKPGRKSVANAKSAVMSENKAATRGKRAASKEDENLTSNADAVMEDMGTPAVPKKGKGRPPSTGIPPGIPPSQTNLPGKETESGDAEQETGELGEIFRSSLKSVPL